MEISKGLWLQRNSCFINCSLLATGTVPEIINLAMKNHHADDCIQFITTHAESPCAGCQFERFVKSFSQQKAFSRVAGDYFRTNRKLINPSFGDFKQHDVHEFLVYFLEKLAIAAAEGPYPTIEISKCPSYDLYIKNSVIHQIFGFLIDASMWCSEKHSFKNVTPELILSLNLENQENTSVQALISKFSKKNSRKYRCRKCNSNENKSAIERFSFYKLPKVLILHVKRFTGHKDPKNKAKVTVQRFLNIFETFSKKTFNFELHAVIQHNGKFIFSGHFVTFLRAGNSGNFVVIDNEKATPVDFGAVRNCEPYILVYTDKTQKTRGVINLCD